MVTQLPVSPHVAYAVQKPVVTVGLRTVLRAAAVGSATVVAAAGAGSTLYEVISDRHANRGLYLRGRPGPACTRGPRAPSEVRPVAWVAQNCTCNSTMPGVNEPEPEPERVGSCSLRDVHVPATALVG